jgi:hypothetical protein
VLAAQAASADGNPFFIAIAYYSYGSDIGRPVSLCVSLGVAHIISKANPLTANLTSHNTPL